MSIETTWFLKSPDGKGIYGPYPLEEVQKAWQVGKIKNEVLVSPDKTSWSQVGQIIPSTISGLEETNIEDYVVPEKFSHYKIMRELGRGGMGVVYKAMDTRVNRVIALKVLLPGHWGQDERSIQRFRREAELTAQLSHPNIVQVFDVGDSPQPFLAMEFIEGDSLYQLLSKGFLSLKDKVQIFRKICLGMECAHKEKIIHRDLKPSNILMDKQGNPKISDFGLARSGQSKEDRLSLTGEVLGTPQYMAPEQAESKRVNHRADIYSLGAVLYELITNRPTFEGDSVINILSQLATNDPLPPRLLNPDIPKDLEMICLTCLQKNPRKRYDSTGALRRDIERYLENRPISVRPPSPWERSWKWMQRNKLISVSTLIISIALIISSFLLYQKVQLQKQLVSEAYQNGCDYFQNHDFTAAKELFRSVEVDDYRADWMQGILALIQGDREKAQRNFQKTLERSTRAKEQGKLLLLLALTESSSQRAQALAKKAGEILGYSSKANSQNIEKWGEKNALGDKIWFRRPLSEREHSILRARFYSLISLVPNNVARAAFDRLQSESHTISLEEALHLDLTKIHFLLSSQVPSWLQAFRKHYPDQLLEIKEMAFYVKKKWILDMASPYWAHLPFAKQEEYATLYQSEYVRQLNISKEQEFSIGKGKMAMLLIPPGQFLQGTAYSEGEDGPQHQVVISKAFWLSKTETTRQQWQYIEPSYNLTKEKAKREDANLSPQSPMVFISAEHITSVLSKEERFSLPNESQWEYACKAGYSRAWIVRADSHKYLKFSENTQGGKNRKPHEVATTRPNKWGLYNMWGNVSEFCDAFVPYEETRRVDPPFNSKISNVSVRGGYAHSNLTHCRATYRLRIRDDKIRHPFIGFRLMLKAE